MLRRRKYTLAFPSVSQTLSHFPHSIGYAKYITQDPDNSETKVLFNYSVRFASGKTFIGGDLEG